MSIHENVSSKCDYLINGASITNNFVDFNGIIFGLKLEIVGISFSRRRRVNVSDLTHISLSKSGLHTGADKTQKYQNIPGIQSSGLEE